MEASTVVLTGMRPRESDVADDLPAPPSKNGGVPQILLATTLRWPLAARLAIAFRNVGCVVHAWCPAGHPLEKTRAVAKIHRCSALATQRSLRAAIGAAFADFIIPCDDNAAIHLHRLYERSASAGSEVARQLIERSLGTPASCSLATERGNLMRLARAEGVRTPETTGLATLSELDGWSARNIYPAVIKVDQSWGGLGVFVVRDIDQARHAFRTATGPSVGRALSHLILRRDPSHLLRWFSTDQPAVTIQNFVVGRPANRAVACWQGEVLAGISVVALQTQGPIGPATVVQVIENQEMSDAAKRMVRALGISGFCGLDFVLEKGSGAAHLIEVNPRATPIAHLALGAGHDLPAALCARLTGESSPPLESAVPGGIIAMFPGELRRNILSPYLHRAFHDVPWTEMGLVHDCVAPPWEDRGIAARIRARLNPRRSPDFVSFPPAGVRPVQDSSLEN